MQMISNELTIEVHARRRGSIRRLYLPVLSRSEFALIAQHFLVRFEYEFVDGSRKAEQHKLRNLVWRQIAFRTRATAEKLIELVKMCNEIKSDVTVSRSKSKRVARSIMIWYIGRGTVSRRRL
jgi:hypothetical protein